MFSVDIVKLSPKYFIPFWRIWNFEFFGVSEFGLIDLF